MVWLRNHLALAPIGGRPASPTVFHKSSLKTRARESVVPVVNVNADVNVNVDVNVGEVKFGHGFTFRRARRG